MQENNIGLNTGIFLPSDISLILGMKQQKINRWLNMYWSEKINYTDTTKTINFLTLIEIYVFNTFLEKGISRKKIISFHEDLKQIFNISFPFAYKAFFYNSKEIFTTKNKCLFDTTGNYVIKDFITPFANKIDFSEKTHLANCFYPQGKSSNIIVNPEIQFGKPIIKGTRITIDVIYEMLKQKNSTEEISCWYEIDEIIVKEIANFYNYSA